MKEENKRKGIIYLTIGVITLLVLIVGATYAYFQAQMGNGESFDVNATTGTTDVLSFLMSDIDVSKDNQNILDNHNRTEEKENEDIVINASQDNFGQNDKSLGDGVSAKAILKANNTSNTAEQTYNVFFVMEETKNNLIYTIDEKHPELIMTVIDPDDKEVTNIEGLNYHEKDKDNPNDVSGFDITGRSGAFAIKTKQEIKVEATNEKHETTQEWKIKVTLVNFPNNNQNNNTGKEITGEVVITQEDKDTYKLVHVKKVNETNKTAHSITTSLDYDKGTNEIKEYYFGIEEIGPVSTVSLEEVKFNKSEENEYTFRDLKDNTNYKIYGYVVDSEGFKSNTYEGKTNIATEKAPVVEKVSVTSKSYNEINISVEASKGTNEIVGYEYSISGANIPETKVTEETNQTKKFDNLSESQQYQISVRAKDNKGNYSLPYKLTKSTAQIYRYDYTENRQETGESYAFSVPSNGTYKIELWGASGGLSYAGWGVTGLYNTQGLGGYTSGTITLTTDIPLYVYVGSKGTDGEINGVMPASFNGGGSGGTGLDNNDASGSGGGATDIRTNNGEWNSFASLKTRIMVAGGGAGGTDSGLDVASAGSGGGLTGVGDSWHYPQTKLDSRFNATQTSGFKFGIGENGLINGEAGSGGGGGYYGGLAYNISSSHYGGGGGGSSFISGHAGCLAIDGTSLENSISLKAGCTEASKTVECATHYSNYKFENTEMIDGLGYKWTTEAGEQTGMPSPTGGNETGHNGNGYARITPISIADE